jgi:uncharacterized protein YndB with AHSA1/START domain
MTPDKIEKQVLLRAPRARVWRALTDSKEFGTWFGVRFDGAFQPGARVRGVITPTQVNAEVAALQKPHEGTPFEITVESMEPECLFSFRWHPGPPDPGIDYANEPTTLVSFKLEEQPGGTLLTLTETGFEKIPLERRAAAFSANEGGWTWQMKLIEAYLAIAP